MHRTLAAGLMGLLLAGSPSCAKLAPPATLAPAPPVGVVAPAPVGAPLGYYRQPALKKDTIVFTAEGDLWKVSDKGGVATRLTSHPAAELQPAISPDGQWLAFIAGYEGPQEVYVMPMSGGVPKRLTWDDAGCGVQGWTADGRIIARTDKLSTLPSQQTTLIDPATGTRTLIPLAQCADAAFDPAATTAAAVNDAAITFVRIPFNGSFTKRYKGGTIEQLWHFKKGEAEAVNLTGDYPGTSKRPLWFQGRVYFLSDRDNHMNIWSMTPDGKDIKQHTRHVGFDIMGASLDSTGSGRIVYQLQADIHIFDIASGETHPIAITLDSDLDQMRERWVEKPVDWITSAHLSPDGEKVAITARGRVFVVPHRQGRIVDVMRDDGVRYRDARFLKDSDTLVSLSDKSGEVEVWKMPANGIGDAAQLTTGSTVLKWGAFPSPDGKFIAHHNKNHELWILNTETQADTRIDSSTIDDFSDLTWSADSRWLAYVAGAANAYNQIKLWCSDAPAEGAPPAAAGPATVTGDRYTSYSPAWSADGQWLFFLSDRTFRTVVGSPWGNYQPDPYLDDTTKIYALALKPGLRWPYLPKDEVQAAKDKAEKEKDKDKPKDTDKADDKKSDEKQAEEKKDDAKKDDKKSDDKKSDDKKPAKPKRVEIDLNGLAERLYEVPLKAGNYANLTANDKGLFFTSHTSGFESKADLVAYEIKSEGPELKTVLADINSYQMSQDTKKLLIRKKDAFYIIDAAAAPASDLEKKALNLAGWSLNLIPRQQWKQMFIESWRLMRDYFWDTNMHGVDWRAMLDKYLPLVDRATNRAELSDIIAQMVGELSALHHFVRGGDIRTGRDDISFGNLGGVLVRDEANGGWRITRIYQSEPDDPQRISPLAKPEVACKVGDVIDFIDGVSTLSVPDYQQLLRTKAGRQVLLHIKPAKVGGADGAGFDAARDAIIVPISAGSESDLRYTDWEYSRRLMVEKLSGGRIGYLHLRAMGGGDWSNFVKGFYPVFNREGLILDVRNNRGGNIDSWVLSKLLRKQWAAFTDRVANPPSWNMQYAFRGHMVGLCNERTSSDGETFCEGMRRLNLGKVIGVRTWGGGIWLTSSNVLVDRGLASASEFGVFGPEGNWMIEGRGFEPDITVDNGPSATFNGDDTQLKAAVEHLMKLMAEQPVKPLTPPTRPIKSSPDNAAK